MAKIVIIGAGLTGLSAAYHLEKKKNTDFAIFEKEQTIGGLCRSILSNGFTFDFTGHLLHINDPYFKTIIEKTVGLQTMYMIQRKSAIHSYNRLTPYPYQMHLHGLPTEVIIDCITGYINRTKRTKKNETFMEWINAHFGTGFARHFFLPYQEKIFAYDPHEISASWTGRFVPQTSLEQIIRGTLEPQESDSIGYNSNFFYPKKGGIVSWVDKLAQQIQKPIHTEHTVQSIDIAKKTVIFANSHHESYDQLITTMPLDILLDTIIEKPSHHLKQARKKLLCNSVLNFNLGINRPNLSDKHWIYFPEKEYPFYRIGFPHNLSQHSVPPGCSSLYGEFAYINKSPEWITRTQEYALQKTKQLLSFETNEIICKEIITIPRAYVIFDFWREKNLENLLSALAHESIYSVGRYGAWKYASMQEAVLDGKEIVDLLTITPAQRIKNNVPKKNTQRSNKTIISHHKKNQKHDIQ